MERLSTVKIRENNESKQVRIGSSLNVDIPESIITKWQSLIDTAARLANVPAGLIMRLNESTIEVFLKSNTDGNPYKEGEEAKLIYGLYCETVIGKQEKLLIPDATKSRVWKKNNPDVDIHMISYLGFPINWPNGEVFGTVCLLDKKENHYNKDFENLLSQIKQHVENDLRLQLLNKALEEKNIELEQLNKTKSRFLALISHDIRGSVATIDEFIKLIINDFDQYDNEELKSILESLSKNASSSSDTLENLLRWSKSDIVQLQPDIKPVDVIKGIETLLQYFDRSIQLKGITVRKSYYSSSAFIDTDEDMLTVVLRNILSNAIKYNKKYGELMIQVTVYKNKHLIKISDNGIGMSQVSIGRLFTYDEVRSVGTSGESGAGIGLMLVKEFIDKLDADIFVDSKKHKGTTFTLKI